VEGEAAELTPAEVAAKVAAEDEEVETAAAE
jgi:hypothetical protein